MAARLCIMLFGRLHLVLETVVCLIREGSLSIEATDNSG
jgi:hypothetical protein